jgi:membrane-associated phospholipid phosphatase
VAAETRWRRTTGCRAPVRPFLAFVSTGAALLVFGLLALRIRDHHPPSWDERGLHYLSPQARGHAVGSTLKHFAALVGDDQGLWLVAILVAVLLGVRRVQAALLFAIALIGTLATVTMLKPFFDRPSLVGHRHGYFPSTHAAGALVVGLAGAWLGWSTRWRWTVLALSLGIVALYGAALVCNRDHYPSDVVSGWCIGLGWSGAFALLDAGADRLRRGQSPLRGVAPRRLKSGRLVRPGAGRRP